MVWRQFCATWWERWRDAEILTADLLELAEQVENFYLRGESQQARKISLGRQLEKKAGAVYSQFKILRAGITGGCVYWRLEALNPGSNTTA